MEHRNSNWYLFDFSVKRGEEKSWIKRRRKSWIKKRKKDVNKFHKTSQGIAATLNQKVKLFIAASNVSSDSTQRHRQRQGTQDKIQNAEGKRTQTFVAQAPTEDAAWVEALPTLSKACSSSLNFFKHWTAHSIVFLLKLSVQPQSFRYKFCSVHTRTSLPFMIQPILTEQPGPSRGTNYIFKDLWLQSTSLNMYS